VDALLVATIAYMLVAVANVNELFPFLLPLRLGLVTVAVGTLLYLGHAKGRRSFQRLTSQPPVRMMFALFAWCAVCVPVALAPGGTFRFVFQTFITTVILFFLLVGATRGARDFQRLALWFLVGAVIYATKAMFGFDPSQAGSWRMADVTGQYDANDFAVLCVMSLPLAIHFVRQKGPLVVRLGAAWGLYALTSGVVLSGSRGGLLATAAMGMFLLFRATTIPFRWRAVGVAAAVAVLAVRGSAQYWEQMRSIIDPSADYNVTSEFGRKALWTRGLGYALRYPIQGVGASNFGFAEGTISREVAEIRERGFGTPWLVPHNTYIQVLSELGFGGFIVWVLLIVAAWRSLAAAGRASPDPRMLGLVQALQASMVGTLVGIFFLSHAYTAMTYTVLAMAAVAGKALAAGSGAAGGRRGGPAANRLLRHG
jgi:O-antigen ligase